MTIEFRQYLDLNGAPTSVIDFSDYVADTVLSANVAQDFAVPEGVNTAILSSTGNIFVKLNAGATVPSTPAEGSPIGSLTGSTINPNAKRVAAGDTISVISNDDGVYVSIEYFWAGQ